MVKNVNSVLDTYTLGDKNKRGYMVSKNETELCQLAFKYRADKCERIKHPFTPFYYDLFSKRRRSIKKILEIGIGRGASLSMWRDFFPNAQIYGIDHDPGTMFRDERIQTFFCNQSSRKDLEALIAKIGNDIDLLIDDGSHVPSDQVFTCLTLMPLLKKDVIYIIEDVADMNIKEKLKKYNTHVIYLWRSDRKRYHDDTLLVVRNKEKRSEH